MIERRERLRLALEAREPFGIDGEQRRQDLDRHDPIEPGVTRAIHLAHAAGANGTDDLVGSETCARWMLHGSERSIDRSAWCAVRRAGCVVRGARYVVVLSEVPGE